ncbi:MAG: DUF1501 domain-containing protein [Planctomycetota bacterium]|nr:DUF1501 domain-containing protein [Planctomycetota bacterium]
MTDSAYSRRQFLQTGITLASAAATIPAFLNSSALAMSRRMLEAGVSSLPGVPDERVLVVIQLSGGNDGLNTVVPFGMDQYSKVRTSIAVQRDQVLRLSGPNADGVGLHPQMKAMKAMFDEGLAAVVQGVGYPNPNRSHFKSMDIWHTADLSATGDGWLGRYFDAECCGYGKGESGSAPKPASATQNAKAADASNGAANTPENTQPGIAIGRTAPLAMQGRRIKPIAFESAELFRWTGEDIHESLKKPYQDIAERGDADASRKDSNAAFLMRTSLDAQVSSSLIRKAVKTKPQVTFPGTDLGRQLSMVSSMIQAGLKTKVYYVNLGGFDTHAGQGGAQGRHGQLLSQLSEAVSAFYKELKAQGNDIRVMTMCFSEFGRRVAQNASGGTDHGTAAPLFLFGPMCQAGVIGEHPSLTDLDDGDLKFKIDFRSVYAGVLEHWLKADSKVVLEGMYRPLGVVKA